MVVVVMVVVVTGDAYNGLLFLALPPLYSSSCHVMSGSMVIGLPQSTLS